jgi:formylglycine-generating enzyme required for sulfatase activity
MPHPLQHPLLRFLLLGAGLAALALAVAPASHGDPATTTVPHVDPLTQKGFSQAIPGTEVKFDMVPIPGGTFVMGSPPTEKGRSADEGPQHPVRIEPFWMGKCEVTWDEYDAYRKEEAVEEPAENDKRVKVDADAITGPTKPYADETFGHGRENHPVLCITHHAAMEYARWLAKKTGRPYRLPTEAEWEWAARAGTNTAYFFGDDPKALDDYAWYANDDPDELTQEVGKKKPNPWGLYDIYGNVSEWCLDRYEKDAYQKFPIGQLTLEPVVLPGKERFPHVARGGSWADKADRLRSACRRGSDKTWIKRDPQRPQSIWWLTDADFVGIRVICEVKELDKFKGLKSAVTRESPDYPEK